MAIANRKFSGFQAKHKLEGAQPERQKIIDFHPISNCHPRDTQTESKAPPETLLSSGDMKKTCNLSVTRKSPAQGRQLEIFGQNLIVQRPQITSVPGVSVRERNRYRVMLGDTILGDFLTIEQAVTLAKRGAK